MNDQICSIHHGDGDVEQSCLLNHTRLSKGSLVGKERVLEVVAANVALVIRGLRGAKQRKSQNVSSRGVSILAVIQESSPIAILGKVRKFVAADFKLGFVCLFVCLFCLLI